MLSLSVLKCHDNTYTIREQSMCKYQIITFWRRDPLELSLGKYYSNEVDILPVYVQFIYKSLFAQVELQHLPEIKKQSQAQQNCLKWN